MLNKNFSFIEAPVYQGQSHYGVSLGPSFIRQMLLDQNYHFRSLLAQESQSKKKICPGIYEEVSYLVERELRRRQLVFIAGGDHSLSIGSIQGLLRCHPNAKVLWVDAHGDVNTTQTSLTKSFHGMPLAFLLGLDPYFNESGWFDVHLKPENLIYFGLRDLDEAEKQHLEQLNIQHYSAKDIHENSIDEIIQKIKCDVKDQILHLSIDADAFDPTLAPSTGVPVNDGLTFGTVEKLVKNLLDVAEVKSIEYVEVNPQIYNVVDDVFKTAQIGIDLFKLVLEKHKQQEVFHGFDDRFGDSKEPGLHDSDLKLEKQSQFTT